VDKDLRPKNFRVRNKKAGGEGTPALVTLLYIMLKDHEVSTVYAAASFVHRDLPSVFFWLCDAAFHPTTPPLFTSSPVEPVATVNATTSLWKVPGVIKASSIDS
jgi:hypothetical protein